MGKTRAWTQAAAALVRDALQTPNTHTHTHTHTHSHTHTHRFVTCSGWCARTNCGACSQRQRGSAIHKYAFSFFFPLFFPPFLFVPCIRYIQRDLYRRQKRPIQKAKETCIEAMRLFFPPFLFVPCILYSNKETYIQVKETYIQVKETYTQVSFPVCPLYTRGCWVARAQK